jgi:hypothetical protein
MLTRGGAVRALLFSVPDEVWTEHILPLLPPDALVRFGGTARRWHALVRHERLWRRLSFAGACAPARARLRAGLRRALRAALGEATSGVGPFREVTPKLASGRFGRGQPSGSCQLVAACSYGKRAAPSFAS